MNVLDRLHQLGVIPVVKIDDANRSTQLAEALIRGGLPCVEITFRTEVAREAIYQINKEYPDMLVGAGTVLTPAQAEQAASAGAKFIVSPGFEPKVVDWCQSNHLAVIPGIATPTEALMALDKNLSVLKFFPCEALGGIPTLEAISAALVGIKFIPTGGITIHNIANYLRLPVVHAVAGSWMATSSMINDGAFRDITSLVGEAVTLVQRVRKDGGGGE
jgi:2-dehydro-3-deoxyphosphogluconate aldolase/(4S)-4-hydroxy-2-oxoglutarate aldolase